MPGIVVAWIGPCISPGRLVPTLLDGNYDMYQSIDLPPGVHEQRNFFVEYWRRLAVEVTHYRHGTYLLVVDCNLGRMAI